MTITNATDISTGVATLMLTPSGGVGTLPVMATGLPGLPPVIDSVTATTLTAGSSATATLTTVSSGGNGVASHYTLALGIPAGASGTSANAVQTIQVLGSPTGGTFTLTFVGQTTAAIAYNATAATVQTAIGALSTVGGTSNVSVSGSAGGPWTVTFASALTAMSALVPVATLTGGTSPWIDVSSGYTINAAYDIEGTQTDQYILKWVTADNKFKYASQLCGDTINATTFTAYSGNATQATLAYVSVPAQKFNWRPRVSGYAIATGTANTQIDLMARAVWRSGETVSTGDIVGYGLGVKGAGYSPASPTVTNPTIPSYPITLNPSFLSGSTPPFTPVTVTGSSGTITAGSAATIYFLARRADSTGDAWSVASNTCSFTVTVDPVPGTN